MGPGHADLRREQKVRMNHLFFLSAASLSTLVFCSCVREVWFDLMARRCEL